MDEVKEDRSIRALTQAVAGNIGDTDVAAAIVVVEADGTVRVTPVGGGIAGTIQVLSLGASMLAAKLKVLPFPFQPPVPETDGGWSVIAQEGETCYVPAGTLVRYGAAGQFVEKAVDGPVACSNDVFGDPIFGTAKACSILSQGTMTEVDLDEHKATQPDEAPSHPADK